MTCVRLILALALVGLGTVVWSAAIGDATHAALGAIYAAFCIVLAAVVRSVQRG